VTIWLAAVAEEMPVSSVVVAATLPVEQERLWALLCDTRRYPEWVEMTTAVVRTDGPTRPGSTYEERNRLVGPFTVRSRWTVTEFDPPRHQQHIGTGVAACATYGSPSSWSRPARRPGSPSPSTLARRWGGLVGCWTGRYSVA
jgi:hypothetical protein